MKNNRTAYKRRYTARNIFQIFNGIFMLLVVIAVLIPIFKVFVDSLDKSTTYGINLWPKNPSFRAYKVIFSNKDLYRPFIISLITTAAGTFFGMFFITLGAYVLTQKEMFGRNFFALFIFITMIFSGGLVPNYLLMRSLGLINTLWAVILPQSLNVYNMFLMKNFFEQIPNSLIESAEIDGATPIETFVRIVLPLSSPALASISLFFAVSYWNSFFDFVIYITDTDLYNFQVKLREMIISDQTMPDPSLAGYGNAVKNAVTIVAMIPPLILYPFCQRYFVTGITLGAVKG